MRRWPTSHRLARGHKTIRLCFFNDKCKSLRNINMWRCINTDNRLASIALNINRTANVIFIVCVLLLLERHLNAIRVLSLQKWYFFRYEIIVRQCNSDYSVAWSVAKYRNAGKAAGWTCNSVTTSDKHPRASFTKQWPMMWFPVKLGSKQAHCANVILRFSLMYMIAGS